MDDTALISAIFKRKIIWNPMEELHKHPIILRKLWEEVAQELDKDLKSVKSRWKNLRTYFFRECKKIENSRFGDGTETFSCWHLFNKLEFLHVAMNVPEPYCTLTQMEGTHSLSVEESTEYPLPNTASVPPRKRKRYINNSDKIEELLEIEKQKIKILLKRSEQPVNDDSLFFDSLLPYMKDIPKRRKLILRNKIQELILDELQHTVPSSKAERIDPVYASVRHQLIDGNNEVLLHTLKTPKIEFNDPVYTPEPHRHIYGSNVERHVSNF